MDRIDIFIALKSVELIEHELAIILNIPDAPLSKESRKKIMRAWGFVQRTNAWKYGDDSFGMLKADSLDAMIYWCWYTSLALDICKSIRDLAEKYEIALPNG